MKKVISIIVITILIFSLNIQSYAKNEILNNTLDDNEIQSEDDLRELILDSQKSVVGSGINETTSKIGVYKIAIGADPNKTLEVAGGNTSNGAQIDIWNYGNAMAQKFNFEYIDGFYKITARHTGKSLTVSGNNMVEGAKIVQSDYIGSKGQKWILRDSHKNGWVISLLNDPSLSISVENSIQNGANIILSRTTCDNNQMMYLYNITNNERTKADGIYKLAIGADSNKTLEVGGSSTSNGATVDIWNYGNAMAQKFYLKYVDGYYKIVARHTGKCLTVKGNNLKVGTEIIQSDYVGSKGQKWILTDSHKNGWVISLLDNPDLSISVKGSIQNGARIILDKTKYNNNQMLYMYNISSQNRVKDNAVYKIAVGANSKKTIEIAGSSKSNNAKVDIWDYGYVDAQKFYLEYCDEGYYKIIANHSGKSLTIKNENISEHEEVVQSDYVASDAQKWVLTDSHKNGWIISSFINPNLSLCIEGNITNGAKIILSRTQANNNQMFYLPKIDKNIKEGLYGKSGLMYKGTGGSYLKYYQIGKGSKHLFLNFAIHGFEDSYSYDGQELTYLADKVNAYLKNNMSEELIDRWTVYILPSLNPDGEYSGWTNNGPGRTSLYSWAEGNRGIDMNRCFPVGFTRANSSRNYNGTQPLQAYEAQALREFILNNSGNQNVVIDIHGWLNETIGDNGIGSFYRNKFGISKHIDSYGKGYFIQWARTIPNTRSMLLELPEVNSHSQLINRGYVNKFNSATMNLLKSI